MTKISLNKNQGGVHHEASISYVIIYFDVQFSLACSLGGIGNSQEIVEEPAKEGQNRCGDDGCDGPENTRNCPEDCETGVLVSGPKEDGESSCCE